MSERIEKIMKKGCELFHLVRDNYPFMLGQCCLSSGEIQDTFVDLDEKINEMHICSFN